jgi:hypothetical protein
VADAGDGPDLNHGDNAAIIDSELAGSFGGKCVCFDGTEVSVGDENNNCASLSCVGGTAVDCNRHSNIEWSHKTVKCQTNIKGVVRKHRIFHQCMRLRFMVNFDVLKFRSAAEKTRLATERKWIEYIRPSIVPPGRDDMSMKYLD